MKTMNSKLVRIVRGLLILMVATLLMACGKQVEAQSIEKSDLSILYVGPDPSKPLSDRDRQFSVDPDRSEKLQQKRAADFKSLLNQYFSNVEVVYSDNYKEELSAKYDVTIFDTLPPKLSGGRAVDPETGEETYERRQYLSEGYNHATVMIAEPSAFIGEGRQLKIDHLCLCLDAHAHSMKLDHPIFHTPYKVDITYEERKTPGNYVARYGGRDLGETIPMWRMQTEGYHDGKGFPVGLVSTGYGFDNDIDAEWISSGRCDKGVEATAIGRHANFFHWGFVAAPEYMTESAKLAFINAIHYIAPYKGAKQVTRKIKGIQLKPYLREQQWTVSDQGSAQWLAYLEKGRQKSLQERKQIEAKKQAGEALTDLEKMKLEFPEQKQETRAWTIRHEPEALKEKFGEDWSAYENYYAENLDYFYPVAGEWYKVTVDEDAKSLGIPNNDIKLLDTAVAMLAEGDRKDMAMGILTRYTKESFQTAKKWKNWLQENRDQLYFSEGDGYKFIVIPKQ